MKQVNYEQMTELTEILSNIGCTCRSKKISSLQILELKQLFQERNFDALKNLRSLHKSHPRLTSPEISGKILMISLEHPGWGCVCLSNYLKNQGISISPPTVQGILNVNGLGKKSGRAGVLEQKEFRDGLVLSLEQVRMIEKINPCYKERLNQTQRPGELLVQDVILLGSIKSTGKVFLQMVVDTYNNYVFGRLDLKRSADTAAAMLHIDVIPFYIGHQLPIKTILTDNGREFSGKENHHYELYLMLNDIEHRKLPLHQSQTNGFMLKFRKTVVKGFSQKIFIQKKIDKFEDLQEAFEMWTVQYNHSDTCVGYPNMGISPVKLLEDYLSKNKI